jgi:hypothetical protein
MKKVLLVLAIGISMGAAAQSIGTIGGVSGSAGSGSGYSWGAWIEGKTIGFEYNYSISASNLNMTNIGINTTDDFDFSYYKANSFGITAKAAMNLNASSFVGAGIQSIYSETISTDTKKNKWRQDILPYLSFGYMTRLNDVFNFRGEAIIGKAFSVGVGIGININRL